MKITFIRHGRPQAASNRVVNADGFRTWVGDYNRSRICASSRPDANLKPALADALVLSSDMPRAQHSAEICLARPADRVMPELRELDIPCLSLPLRMRIGHWLLLSRLVWLLGFSPRAESFVLGKKRLHNAVAQLLERMNETTHVAVFGHGLAIKLMVKLLQRQGWQVVSQSRDYWGQTQLTKAP